MMKIINRQSRKSRGFLSRLFVMCLSFFLLFTSIAFAGPPPDPEEVSVPVQLLLIREALDDLSQQLTDTESRLNDKLGQLQNDVTLGNDKLDTIYKEITRVDITMTTVLCFDVGVNHDERVGGHGEFGVGWPNVLDAKAIVQADGGYGINVGIGNQICIEVPLYSVESFKTQFDNDLEFDTMVKSLAYPSQEIIPIIGTIYGELMPTPEEAIEATGNVINAATGFDIGDGVVRPAGPDPALLARPDILLEPVIPDILTKFIDNAPDLVEDAITDPCPAFANTPLGEVVDPALYDWICVLDANAIGDLGDALGGLGDIIGDLGDDLEDLGGDIGDIYCGIFPCP
jgi:hypothetical protein